MTEFLYRGNRALVVRDGLNLLLHDGGQFTLDPNLPIVRRLVNCGSLHPIGQKSNILGGGC